MRIAWILVASMMARTALAEPVQAKMNFKAPPDAAEIAKMSPGNYYRALVDHEYRMVEETVARVRLAAANGDEVNWREWLPPQHQVAEHQAAAPEPFEVGEGEGNFTLGAVGPPTWSTGEGAATGGAQHRRRPKGAQRPGGRGGRAAKPSSMA